MAQNSCAVTAKPISSFVFSTRIVKSLSFLNPKFQASSLFLRLYSPVFVSKLIGKPKDQFSCAVAQMFIPSTYYLEFLTQFLFSYQHYMSLCMRKPTIWVLTRSDTNRAVQPQKIVRSLKFWIQEEEDLYYPCSENIGADQLRSYCEADLRLCFPPSILLDFLCSGSYMFQNISPFTFTTQSTRVVSLSKTN